MSFSIFSNVLFLSNISADDMDYEIAKRESRTTPLMHGMYKVL